MIIGSKTQEAVRASFLAKFEDSESQGYVVGLSTLLHAITDLLVGEVLSDMTGKEGASEGAVPMEHVAQLYLEAIGLGATLQARGVAGYNQAVVMSLTNLQAMMAEAMEGEGE